MCASVQTDWNLKEAFSWGLPALRHSSSSSTEIACSTICAVDAPSLATFSAWVHALITRRSGHNIN